MIAFEFHHANLTVLLGMLSHTCRKSSGSWDSWASWYSAGTRALLFSVAAFLGSGKWSTTMSRMASERGSQFCRKERRALRGSACFRDAVSFCRQKGYWWLAFPHTLSSVLISPFSKLEDQCTFLAHWASINTLLRCTSKNCNSIQKALSKLQQLGCQNNWKGEEAFKDWNPACFSSNLLIIRVNVSATSAPDSRTS